MPSERDEALSWEGDDDPTLDDRVGEPAGEPVALPQGFTAVGKGAEGVGRISADGTVVAPGDRQPLGNAALVGIGVLGGIYLLFTIGWILAGFRLRVWVAADAMFHASWWLSILAPAVWFGTAYLLTRGARTWVRIAWLAAGAALLIPWPFLLIGSVPA